MRQSAFENYCVLFAMAHVMHMWLSERGHSRERRLTSAAPRATEAASDYFSSHQHYASLARRIDAALRSGGSLVLITGNPPPNSQALSEALASVATVRYEATIISCGPELTREDLDRTVAAVAGPRAITGARVTTEFSASAFPLVVFDDFDRLSDKQIKEVCKDPLHRDHMQAAGILLTSVDFLARLEQPACFLKKHLAAYFPVQEVGDDEAISFFYNRLLTQRDRPKETRGFRRGILIGLAGSGVALAAGIGVLIIMSGTTEQIRAAPESTIERSIISEAGSILPPAEERITSIDPAYAVPMTETRSASETASSQPLNPNAAETPLTGAQSAMTHTLAELHPVVGEIAALVARGDAFLNSRDIISARLFYERAANAGSGLAALQLGATFDPVIVGRSGTIGVIADPAQALSWYRRARDLGMAEAAQRIKRFETPSLNGQDARSPLK
jgi:hypothetical protein